MTFSIILNIVLWSIISLWCYFVELDEFDGFNVHKLIISIFAPVLATLICITFAIFMLCIRLFGDIDDKTDPL